MLPQNMMNRIREEKQLQLMPVLSSFKGKLLLVLHMLKGQNDRIDLWW